MANDQITKVLQQAVDMARREGYIEGWAAATAAVEKLASSLRRELALAASDKSKPTQEQDQTTDAPRLTPASRIRRRDDKMFTPRMNGGALNQIVANAYKSILPEGASPTDIQMWIRDNDGKELAFTSLRRTIDRLVDRGVLEEIAGTKTWRHREVKKTEAPDGGTPGASNPGGVVPLRR
jgi:hypothetical protein